MVLLYFYRDNQREPLRRREPLCLILCEWDRSQFVNLDLDPLDFKSGKPFFEKAIHRIKRMDLDLSVVVFTGTQIPF